MKNKKNLIIIIISLFAIISIITCSIFIEKSKTTTTSTSVTESTDKETTESTYEKPTDKEEDLTEGTTESATKDTTEGATEQATNKPTEPKETQKPTTTEPQKSSTTEPKHEHSYTTTVKSPTCDTAGCTVHKCSCGASYTDNTVSATGHSFSEWTTTNQPSTTSEGSKKRTCSKCGYAETQAIAKLTPSANWNGDNASIGNGNGVIINNMKRPESVDSAFRVNKLETFIVYAIVSGEVDITICDLRTWGTAPSISLDRTNKTITIAYQDKSGTNQSTTLEWPHDGDFLGIDINDDGTLLSAYAPQFR